MSFLCHLSSQEIHALNDSLAVEASLTFDAVYSYSWSFSWEMSQRLRSRGPQVFGHVVLTVNIIFEGQPILIHNQFSQERGAKYVKGRNRSFPWLLPRRMAMARTGVEELPDSRWQFPTATLIRCAHLYDVYVCMYIYIYIER